MEFLREALGEELYSAVKEKLDKHGNIKLANLADGGYVSRDKYAALEAESGANKKTLEEQKTRIAEYNQLKQAYDELILKNNSDAENFAKQSNQQQKSHAVDIALLQRKAKNITAVKALLDMDKISYKEGALSGFDEQIEPLAAENAYLFGDEIKTSTGMRHSGKNQSSNTFLQTIYENQAKRN